MDPTSPGVQQVVFIFNLQLQVTDCLYGLSDIFSHGCHYYCLLSVNNQQPTILSEKLSGQWDFFPSNPKPTELDLSFRVIQVIQVIQILSSSGAELLNTRIKQQVSERNKSKILYWQQPVHGSQFRGKIVLDMWMFLWFKDNDKSKPLQNAMTKDQTLTHVYITR